MDATLGERLLGGLIIAYVLYTAADLSLSRWTVSAKANWTWRELRSTYSPSNASRVHLTARESI